MRKSDSAHKVGGLLRRIQELQKHAVAGIPLKPKVVSGCINELHIAIEELLVAEEQLKLHNEQLLAARQTIEDERRRYQKLFDLAPDGYLVTDSRGVIREANRAAGKLLNRSPSSLARKPLRVFVAPEDRRAFLTELSSVRKDEPRTMELHLCPRRAPPFAAQLTMASETDRAGEVIGRRWLLCDITDRKRSEQMRSDLEAHAQETLRLKSLGTLAGGIAHDFNNLLTIILGNAELAARDLDPATPAAARIEAIRKAGRRTAELVAQMLACSGQGKARAEPQHLGHVVRSMAGLLKAAVPDKAVLRVNCPRRLPHVLADPAQLRQVVLNLVANAAEAVGDRRGFIKVALATLRADQRRLAAAGLAEAPPAGHYVCLRVRDSGCGMDKETQKRMFDPFFSTKFPGRGLGLAAVMGIVKKHNGAVKVFSAQGKGTTVEVLLPAAGARA
ncbi:MAG: ATP-binding protein [Planctomycetota bacterium]|nr:ATP-binding protein [Planctomycetota bacterium]